MCSTGDRMGVADSNVVIIRAICFFVVNIVVDGALLDSRGLFRTLFRLLLCALDVYCVIVSSSSISLPMNYRESTMIILMLMTYRPSHSSKRKKC